jgi:hypothetical protein
LMLGLTGTRESGIGSPESAPIPDFFAGNRGGNPRFKKDVPDLAGKEGIPDSRFGRESGIGVPIRRAGDFLVWARRHRDPVSRRFPPNRESGIPRFPISSFGQIGNRGNGNWGFGPLAHWHGTCHEPLALAAAAQPRPDVRWRPEISIFEDQRHHLAPG